MVAFFTELWMILTESSVWLIFGFLLAGVVHVLVPREWMLKHLGGKGITPIAKASLLGIPLPLCSCAVIPVAAGLRKQGASKGASAAFAISTPQTGEESIPLTWGLFGPFFALARPVIAVFTGLVAGILIDLTHRTETDADTGSSSGPTDDPNAIGLTITNADEASAVVAQTDKKATGSCCSSQAEPAEGSCCSSTPQETGLGFAGSTREAFRHGFGVMLVDLAIWLALGLIMAAVIGAAVPPGWFEEHVGSGIWPKLVMLVVGIPLYICATSSTPLAFSLVAAGLSPGAALVLLLSGPATNVATMSWLIKDLGIKALVIYLSVIALVALGAGILFDAFFINMVSLADTASKHEHGMASFGYKDVAAVLFVMLMAWALGIRARNWIDTHKVAPPSTGGCCSSTSSTTNATSCGCAAQEKPANKGGCCGS